MRLVGARGMHHRSGSAGSASLPRWQVLHLFIHSFCCSRIDLLAILGLLCGLRFATFFCQMIAKAVAAAAPGKERSSWYERRSAWERTARRRRKSAERARAAAELENIRAENISVWSRETQERSGTGQARSGRDSGRRRRRQGHEEGPEDEPNLLRMTKIQAVVAVAVLLVITVLKIRRGRWF